MQYPLLEQEVITFKIGFITMIVILYLNAEERSSAIT